MSYFGIPVRNGLPIGLGSVAPLASSTSSPFSPASFFANGEQGWWFDPSNFATLFQDSAGTTPVTAVEQPVGLQLDLSKGLVLGPTLLTNGDFSNGTTAWPNSSTGSGTFSVSGGLASLSGTDASNRGITGQGFTTVVGRTYVLTFTASSVVGATLYGASTSAGYSFSLGGGSVPSGTTRFQFTATTTTTYVNFAAAVSTAGSFSIDNITVKELPGNHRFQTTSANRPVVSARVNLLTKTEDFGDAAWTKAGVTVTANTTTAPDGTTTADTIAASGGGFTQNLSQQVAVTAGQQLTYTFYILKTAGTTNGLYGGFSVEFRTAVTPLAEYGATINSDAGSLIAASGWGTAGFASSSVVDAGNYWHITGVTPAAPALTTVVRVYHGVAGYFLNGTRSGTGASSKVLWGADLRPANQGVNLPAYQRVNTSTDYDSTGFPTYIKPNGSNQFMQTNSINFSSTDKMTVWQGVRKLSDAATQVFAELSTIVDSNNGSWVTFSSPSALAFYNKGTSFSLITTTAGAAAPTTKVLTAIGDISGDITTLRLNGAQVAQSTADLGTGNYGNYPAYFYARAGTSIFFNGHDYGSIARGAASTAAQIAAGETYINSLTKAF
jgi:hypothetical protein